MSEQTQQQGIEISKLTIPQLSQIRQQVDNDLTVFQESLQALKMAQQKFVDSKECLERLTPECDGKDILVPLTTSMYVPGVITDCKSVILDIGTGYYAEKDVDDSKEYFKRKVEFVTEQMERIQALAIEKTRLRDAVTEVLEVKLQQHILSQPDKK